MSALEVSPALFLPGAEHRAAQVAQPVHAIVFGAGFHDLTDCEPIAHGVVALASQHTETLACCLLPDRLEWLLADRRELVPGVEHVHSVSTRAAGRLGLVEPLWSGGCVELPVASDDLEAAARAIQELPVREKLVERIPQWPYQMRRI